MSSLGEVNPGDIHALLAEDHSGEAFILVMPYGQRMQKTWITAIWIFRLGMNHPGADIFVFGNDERMVLITRLDNLGKGASGTAVQSMNVHLGIEEVKGLV